MRYSILTSGCIAFSLLANCKEESNLQSQVSESDPIVSEAEYRDGEYFWKPNRIAMALHDGDHYGTPGQYILLNNNLAPDEYGWGSSNLDLPDSWKIKNLRFEGLAIRFENDRGESFSIQPPELNKLDFKILGGGNKSDSELESLWREYALIQE